MKKILMAATMMVLATLSNACTRDCRTCGPGRCNCPLRRLRRTKRSETCAAGEIYWRWVRIHREGDQNSDRTSGAYRPGGVCLRVGCHSIPKATFWNLWTWFKLLDYECFFDFTFCLILIQYVFTFYTVWSIRLENRIECWSVGGINDSMMPGGKIGVRWDFDCW